MKRLAGGIGIALLLVAAGLALVRGRSGSDRPQGATTVVSTTYYIRGGEITPGSPLPASGR